MNVSSKVSVSVVAKMLKLRCRAEKPEGDASEPIRQMQNILGCRRGKSDGSVYSTESSQEHVSLSAVCLYEKRSFTGRIEISNEKALWVIV